MSDVTCPDCLLTPSAGKLLTKLRKDLELARPDDASWWVETCTRCDQPRTIHDDRDRWTFGDAASAERPDGPSLLDVAPEWVTLPEAVYAARVPGDLVLEWAHAGRIEHVSLLPGDDPTGILLRTVDLRAVLGSADQAMPAAVAASWNRRDEIATDTDPPHGVNRRRILVVMGAAIAGGLVPVRALAGKPALKPSTDEMNSVLLRAGKALNCKIDADPSLAVMGEAVNVDRGGDAARQPADQNRGGEGKGGASDKDGGGEGKGGASDKDGGGDGGSDATGKDTDKDRGDHGNGTDLSITSVTVEPDPIASGGSAVITINTSSTGDRLSFMVTASEGVLAQDPERPEVWTWRDG